MSLLWEKGTLGKYCRQKCYGSQCKEKTSECQYSSRGKPLSPEVAGQLLKLVKQATQESAGHTQELEPLN